MREDGTASERSLAAVSVCHAGRARYSRYLIGSKWGTALSVACRQNGAIAAFAARLEVSDSGALSSDEGQV